MLQKIRAARQDNASRERQWFQDDYFDLFVWMNAAGKVLAFQLCYDRLRHERVLAWSEERGFIHRRVDDGEQTPVKNMTPIMVTDGRFAAEDIGAEFDVRGSGMDAAVRDFIRRKIGEAGSRLGESPAGP
jgi:hypothetical protein